MDTDHRDWDDQKGGEKMKYELIIIAILLTLAIVPVITTTIVYASEAYPNWDEDREECIANGGYWKHAFCVYD